MSHRVFVLLPLVLLGTSCDPQVKPAAGGVTAVAAAPVVPSQERETCGATADCESPLRCVDATCRRPTTSRLGEYYWVAGEMAARSKDFAGATVAFQQAMGQFESEKLPPPPALLCAYGSALRKKPNDPKSGEQAARLLHRCVLGTAPGAAEYRLAMAELVELEAQGLDPSVLARDQPAELYLARPAKKTTPDKPALEIQQTVPARDKGYEAFVAAVRTQEAAFAKCYETYATATQKASVSVELQLKYRVTLGDDDIVVGARLELTAPPGLGGPDAVVSQCVRDALAPTVVEFGKNTRLSSGDWKGTVTVVLKPAS